MPHDEIGKSAASARHRRPRERGQALVEFALAAPVLVLLVAGIVQFGVALNFWLDMHRIANQGARWAVVNCGPADGFDPCNPTLETYLEQQPIAGGSNPDVAICYESKTGEGPGGPEAVAGDAVTVGLTDAFTMVPIIGVGTVDLTATATMRLEQKPTGTLAGYPLCA
jgi:TadE-like protein